MRLDNYYQKCVVIADRINNMMIKIFLTLITNLNTKKNSFVVLKRKINHYYYADNVQYKMQFCQTLIPYFKIQKLEASASLISMVR